jgi:hypothetical protein
VALLDVSGEHIMQPAQPVIGESRMDHGHQDLVQGQNSSVNEVLATTLELGHVTSVVTPVACAAF